LEAVVVALMVEAAVAVAGYLLLQVKPLLHRVILSLLELVVEAPVVVEVLVPIQ
jgi:hypothetical protein